jgi:hypothetical protein
LEIVRGNLELVEEKLRALWPRKDASRKFHVDCRRAKQVCIEEPTHLI